ncbi:hypothetical protein BCR43DRAFT_509031 [Syncephalastrum racemosum]|uniref:Uncharacterized protein n=1 Tax=Syncephalastrum racemosum TaxID=13706 RepID=A0A1X2H0F5_SYNRA|nr:hypothetical protein BCR43DRAFT_509031 [Syncephalastrum racemosum]
MTNFEIIDELPRTKFQCLHCGEIYKKREVDQRQHAVQCITAKDELNLAIEHSRKRLKHSSTSDTIDSKAGYFKSIDWIDFVRYVVPTIVLENVKQAPAKDALFALTQVYKTALQREITKQDVKQLDQNVWKWLDFLKTNVQEQKIDISIFTISQHYLQHLELMINAMGPPRYYSAFGMERAIGEIKRSIKSSSAPGVNAGNIIVQLAAQRYVDRMEDLAESSGIKSGEKYVLTASKRSNSAEIWPPLWNATVEDFISYNMERLLTKYWSIYLENVNSINPVIEAGSRLWISEKLRSRKIRREPKVYFGEVIFYFRHTQQGRRKLLALIKAWDVTLDALLRIEQVQKEQKEKMEQLDYKITNEIKTLRTKLQDQTAINTRLLSLLEQHENRADSNASSTKIDAISRYIEQPRRKDSEDTTQQQKSRKVGFSWPLYAEMVRDHRNRQNLPALTEGDLNKRIGHVKKIYPGVILYCKAKYGLSDSMLWSSKAVKTRHREMEIKLEQEQNDDDDEEDLKPNDKLEENGGCNDSPNADINLSQEQEGSEDGTTTASSEDYPTDIGSDPESEDEDTGGYRDKEAIEALKAELASMHDAEQRRVEASETGNKKAGQARMENYRSKKGSTAIKRGKRKETDDEQEVESKKTRIYGGRRASVVARDFQSQTGDFQPQNFL